MTRISRAWIIALVALSISMMWRGPAVAADRDDTTVFLTSADWPPYTSSTAPHGGSEAVVKAAFAAMGVTLVTEYYPWRRAINVAHSDSKYAGYYTEYRSDSLPDCLFSDPIGTSRIGLAERHNSGLTGRSLDELSGIVIGTVLGYVNTPDFDARVRDGRLKVEGAVDDVTNLRKLVAGRFPAVVIDKNVMDYLLENDRPLIGKGDMLTFDDKAFTPLTLSVCFQNNDLGRHWRDVLNEGLKHIDVTATGQAGLEAVFR